MCNHKISIIEDTEDYLVIFKERGIHSASLHEHDRESALYTVSQSYPEVLQIKGKKSIEGGLVHRIDKDTAGLLLFAKNQNFYNHLIECQNQHQFVKEYRAFSTVNKEFLSVGYPPSPLS